MHWIAAPACGAAVYFLIGAVSAAEPLIVRGAWGIATGAAVWLLVAAKR